MTPPVSQREPILTLPGALTALVAVIVAIHIVRAFLPIEVDDQVLELFAFIPARYDRTLLDSPFAGGFAAKIWSFLSYSLLHANATHLIFNMLWLLPFGSALARRFGAPRFYAFMMLTAVAGAMAHLVTHEHAAAPMIGASAAVSGAMAAAIRFAFARGGFLSFGRADAEAAAHVPAQPLLRALRDPRVLAFLLIWLVLNVVFGLGPISIGAESVSVAWQAHIGGFAAGLVMFSLFDPIPRAREVDVL